jgi:hypothetical protein
MKDEDWKKKDKNTAPEEDEEVQNQHQRSKHDNHESNC